MGNPVKIGDDAIVSHGAIVHGPTIGDEVLVGIGAIVLDGATVGKGAIIGARAPVPPKTIISPNTLALGIPTKPTREVRDGEREFVSKERQRLISKVEVYKKTFAE